MFSVDSSFWHYKVYADIREGSNFYVIFFSPTHACVHMPFLVRLQITVLKVAVL